MKELKEETGFIAKKIIKIGRFSPEPGLVTTQVHVYCASELTKSKKELEKSESGMRLKFFPLHEVDRMIQSGALHCGIALSSYLLSKYYLHSLDLLATGKAKG